VSTSFADIFRQNSLLPIVVPRDVHAELFSHFPVDSFAKQCLLEGVDELGYILMREASIAAFEARREGSLNTLSGA